MIIVTGKTFDHRDRLKDLGGRWDADAGNWYFRHLTPPQIEELKKLPGCLVTGADKPQSKPKPVDRSEIDDIVQALIGGALPRDDKPTTGRGGTIFYGDDREYFNRFKDRNPVSYCGFSSLARLIDFIEAIPEHKRTGERGSGWRESGPYTARWSGTDTMQEAIDLARNGWSEGVENARRVADMLTLEHATQRRRAYSVAGGSVSVGRLLAGNPMHMVKRPKLPGSRVITLFVQNNGSAGINGDSMIARSAICCALVDMLESSGYACELVSVTTDYMDGSRRRASEHLVVKLKNAGEKLNLADVAFALGHPAFFRRLGFAMIGQADELRECWASMGVSTEAFNAQHEPERNEFYIPHLKQNARGDTIEEMAINLLPIVKPAGLPLDIHVD